MQNGPGRLAGAVAGSLTGNAPVFRPPDRRAEAGFGRILQEIVRFPLIYALIAISCGRSAVSALQEENYLICEHLRRFKWPLDASGILGMGGDHLRNVDTSQLLLADFRPSGPFLLVWYSNNAEKG